MINRKKARILVGFPVQIMLIGMIVILVTGDALAAGIGALVTSAVYGVTIGFQEKIVRREQAGLTICALLLGLIYLYMRFGLPGY